MQVPEAVEVRIGSSEAFSKCVATDYYAITCEEDGGNKGRRALRQRFKLFPVCQGGALLVEGSECGEPEPWLKDVVGYLVLTQHLKEAN